MTDKRTNAFVNNRLRYAKLGWYTFPVHGIDDDGNCGCGNPSCRAPGKHPRYSGKDHRATIDPDVIRQERFQNSNVGLHCGLTGVIVIDVDPRNGGDQTMKALANRHGRISADVIALTGGGGTHLFFKAPADGSSLPSTLGPGIDVLADNKYPVIWPGRHHSGGKYAWKMGCDPFTSAFLMGGPPRWIPAMAKPPRSAPQASRADNEETDEDVARLRSALSCVSADCARAEWRDNLFSIHALGWNAAEDIAREWSQTAPHRWSEDAFENIWNSADAGRDHGRGPGSIFHQAKQAGWIDPKVRNHPETLGDVDNGRRYAEANRDHLVFDRASGRWMKYDRGIWSPCQAGEEIDAAKRVAESVLTQTAEKLAANPTDANRLAHAQATRVHRNARHIDAMIRMAAAEPGMSVPGPTAFDADPMILGVIDGAIDLKSGKLLPASPRNMISKCAGVRYDPDVTCDEWRRFLRTILPRQEERRFLQTFTGYTMTGLVDEEVMLFMYGSGANGKSVMANILSSVFGTYAITVGTELLAVTKHDSEAARHKSRLPGTRLALANEVGQSDTFNDQRLKEIVSREAISARRLYGEAFNFDPSHTLWIRGNHKPAVLDAGDAMWRRIILLHFAQQIPASQRVRDLDRKLLEREGSGILNWAIRGCLRWQKEGLQIPRSIQRETAQYRGDTDVVGEWIENECEAKAEVRSAIQEIFGSYRAFCNEVGITPKTRPSFVRLMGTKGFRRVRSNGRDYFQGITLKADDI